MENYENNELRQERPDTSSQAGEDQPQSESQPGYEVRPAGQPGDGHTYSGSGVGRKESPFADSPYVMNQDTYGNYSDPYRQPHYAPPVPPQEPPKKPRAKKNGGRKVWKAVLASVLTVALVVCGCGITAAVVNNRWEDRTAQMESSFNQQLSALQQQISAASGSKDQATSTVPNVVDMSGQMTAGQVYASNVQSVVLITCQVTTTTYGRTTTGTSAGSGFILTEDGYIITNHHVVEGATSVTVSTYDGAEYAAKIIGSDSTNDVAVLKVDAEGLSAVSIGSSDDLAVGDQVVAIGNPLGELTSTLTVGYVSAKDRDVTTEDTILNMIQTDAAINSGNSGGPLFNMKGEVVGITTAKYSGSSSSGATIEGIGFAIPIDDVMPLVEDLMNYGYVTSAYLGVMVKNMDAETASYYGLPMGAYVEEVTSGYCAEKAGVQAKDIIVALGDTKVENYTDLTRALRNYKAGDTTTITVYRAGQELTLSITLDEKPQEQTTGNTQMPDAGEMPEDGSFEEWYNYFAPFFNKGNG